MQPTGAQTEINFFVTTHAHTTDIHRRQSSTNLLGLVPNKTAGDGAATRGPGAQRAGGSWEAAAAATMPVAQVRGNNGPLGPGRSEIGVQSTEWVPLWLAQAIQHKKLSVRTATHETQNCTDSPRAGATHRAAPERARKPAAVVCRRTRRTRAHVANRRASNECQTAKWRIGSVAAAGCWQTTEVPHLRRRRRRLRIRDGRETATVDSRPAMYCGWEPIESDWVLFCLACNRICICVYMLGYICSTHTHTTALRSIYGCTPFGKHCHNVVLCSIFEGAQRFLC